MKITYLSSKLVKLTPDQNMKLVDKISDKEYSEAYVNKVRIKDFKDV